MENRYLITLSETVQQAAAALLANEVTDSETDNSSRQNPQSFLTVVGLGGIGAGKSTVLNSFIGYPVLPTGENGVTRIPIVIELQTNEYIGRGLVLQADGRTKSVSASEIRNSLLGQLAKWQPSGHGPAGEIELGLITSSAPPLKLVDLPDFQRGFQDSFVNDYAKHSDALLLFVVPATEIRYMWGSRGAKLLQALDFKGRTIGVISKMDQLQPYSDHRNLAAVQSFLRGEGPFHSIPWVALMGLSVTNAAAHGGGGAEDSSETAWRAEVESLKSILGGASVSKLGRIALVETLSEQIQMRLKYRLPEILPGRQSNRTTQASSITSTQPVVPPAEPTSEEDIELELAIKISLLSALREGVQLEGDGEVELEEDDEVELEEGDEVEYEGDDEVGLEEDDEVGLEELELAIKNSLLWASAEGVLSDETTQATSTTSTHPPVPPAGVIEAELEEDIEVELAIKNSLLSALAEGVQISESALHSESARVYLESILGTPNEEQQAGETATTGGRQCVVCLDAPAEAICIPCGHIAGCIDCLSEIRDMEGGNGCPICRTPIEQVYKAYIV